MALVFDTDEGVVTDGGMEIYTGSACTGTLTALACDDDNSDNGNMPSLTLGGFTPGDTVWIRFWEKDNNNNGTFGDYNAKITSVSANAGTNPYSYNSSKILHFLSKNIPRGESHRRMPGRRGV